jgi:hypothetical protein
MNFKSIIMSVLAFSLGTSLVSASPDHDHGHEHGHEHGAQNSVGVLTSKSKNNDHEGHDHGKHDDHKGHDHGKKGDHDEHSGHDDHGHAHGGAKAIGEGKAITKVDEKLGFKLSKSAIKNLKLKLTSVDGSTIVVDNNVMVRSKGKIGVYRFKDGFFKFLNAKLLVNNMKAKKVKLLVPKLDFGDQIVINGVSLLRVTDIYSTDKSEYGHAH